MKNFVRGVKPVIKDERGAVIIIVAFLLFFVLIGMVAISVDVGYLYLQRRHQQTTADAAALAAAWHLPWGGPEDGLIVSTAQTYISENNMNVSSGTVTPHNGDNDKVKVVIEETYSLFFAQAPPIFTPDAEVYAMAVATKDYTFIDMMPFFMLEYEDIINESERDPWESEWDDWRSDRVAFYSLMKEITPIYNVEFWKKTEDSPGNFGIADMRDFVGSMSLSGNPNAGDIQYILKQGLDESFCLGEGKQRRGRPGFVTAIETSNPDSDGMKLSQRLARDEDFFVPLILQGVASGWDGNSYEDFGLEDFIIGHFRDLQIASGNKVMVGTLVDVYYCPDIPDHYKKWFPVLIE